MVFPSSVFTCTEPGPIFSSVPLTWTLLPCAKETAAANASRSATARNRRFIDSSRCEWRWFTRGSLRVLLLRFRLSCGRCIQELFFLLFFRAFFRPFWIIPLHFQAFRSCQIGEVPNEVHQLPTVLSFAVVATGMVYVA